MFNIPPFCCPPAVVPKPFELLAFRPMGGVGAVVVQRVLEGGVGGEEALLELAL